LFSGWKVAWTTPGNGFPGQAGATSGFQALSLQEVEEHAMGIEVRIPTMLRNFSKGVASVQAEGKTVGEALKGLETPCPGIGAKLFGDDGRLRKFINVYLDDNDIRVLQGLDTPVGGAKKMSIILAVAGGR
jgi:molybdopterin converting factor small subunit